MCMTEGLGVFTTPHPLRTIATNTRPRGHGLTTAIPEHGPVRPVVFDATSPLTPLSRFPLRLHAHAPSCVRATSAAAERSTWVGKRRETPRPPLPTVRENQTARDDPRCLPSTGTLRRIRWPLQPRSRDPRIRFWRMRGPLDDVLTPPWALSRSSSVCPKPLGITIRRFDRPRTSDV
jgi:hypothetical protein